MSLALVQAVAVGFATIVLLIIAIFVGSVILSAIKIVKEYERGVIFRLGRVQGGPKGPGLFILLPFVDKMVKIDLRTVTMDVPPQDVITRDNVPARVNARRFPEQGRSLAGLPFYVPGIQHLRWYNRYDRTRRGPR